LIADLKPYPEYNTAGCHRLISSLRKSAQSVDEMPDPQITQMDADFQREGLA